MKFSQVSGPPRVISEVGPGDVFTFDTKDRYTRENITGMFRRAGDLPKVAQRGIENEKFLMLSHGSGFVWLREDDLIEYDGDPLKRADEWNRLKVKRVWRVRRVELERIK